MKPKTIFLSFLVILAVFITLFAHFETSDETWGYWEFAKILSQSGKFIITQRSPLYTIYLLLFQNLGYPNAVTVEYIITSLITIFCLSFFFSKFTDNILAVSASLIWLPYMQLSEPPVQKMALAFFCLSLAVRFSRLDRKKAVWSYALLSAAYLFRPVYILPLPLYLFYDLKKAFKNKNPLRVFIPHPKIDWPVWGMLILFFVFSLNKSPFKWNNIFFATTKWFPQNASSEEIIQNYNWSYILEKYGTFVGHDFYETNKEIFGSATNTVEAIRYNPRFVLHTAWGFIRESLPMMVKMTIPYYLYLKYFPSSNFPHLILLGLILFGALKGFKNQSVRIFILGNLAITFISIVFLPQYRYLIFSVFPIFIVGALGWGKIMKSLAMSAFFLILFSPTFMGVNYYNRMYLDWAGVIRNFISDVKMHDLKIMTTRYDNSVSSMRSSYDTIYPLIKNCKGVMSLDSSFLAAFTDIPFERIYDVWEIPPFGKLGDKDYNGLNPDRIDCLLISRELSLYEGFATNPQIRYQNYIRPYADQLISLGAKSYPIDSYGEVIILENR